MTGKHVEDCLFLNLSVVIDQVLKLQNIPSVFKNHYFSAYFVSLIFLTSVHFIFLIVIFSFKILKHNQKSLQTLYENK